MNKTDKELSWSFGSLWNEAVVREDRDMVARDYEWASSLGGAVIDRLYKMNARPYTNPPNARSKRKFTAGNIWEWIVELVLRHAGIIIDTQNEVWTENVTPYGTIRVKGKMDFCAGGKPDFDRAKKEIEQLRLPEIMHASALKIIEGLQKKYGDNELKKIILEIKSVSSFVFDKLERTKTALDTHALQTYHYIKGTEFDEGHIVYICREDCRMMEFGVFKGQLEDKYMEDCAAIAKALSENTAQPEKLLLFDYGYGRFTKNLKVEYSNYLTKIYGFETPEDYRAAVDSTVARWNRVLLRVKKKDKMTAKNLEVLEEIKTQWGDYNELLLYLNYQETEEIE